MMVYLVYLDDSLGVWNRCLLRDVKVLECRGDVHRFMVISLISRVMESLYSHMPTSYIFIMSSYDLQDQ